MRRIISLMLVCFMLVLLLTGCGGGAPAQSSEPAASTSEPASSFSGADNPPFENNAPETPAGNNSGDIYKELGEELEDFYYFVNDSMGVFERAVNDFESTDFELNARGDFGALTGAIVSIVQYDYIQARDNAKEVGQVAKGDAVREEKGEVITFSRSKTAEEDGFGGNQKKGDIMTESGTLDMSANTLVFESKTEREGAVISRTVSEVVVLEDGSIIAQVLTKPKTPDDDRIKDRGHSWFLRLNNKELEIIKAYFEPDVNFTFSSIAGKSDAVPESMADGYTKFSQLIVKDDKAVMTKY